MYQLIRGLQRFQERLSAKSPVDAQHNLPGLLHCLLASVNSRRTVSKSAHEREHFESECLSSHFFPDQRDQHELRRRSAALCSGRPLSKENIGKKEKTRSRSLFLGLCTSSWALQEPHCAERQPEERRPSSSPNPCAEAWGIRGKGRRASKSSTVEPAECVHTACTLRAVASLCQSQAVSRNRTSLLQTRWSLETKWSQGAQTSLQKHTFKHFKHFIQVCFKSDMLGRAN